MAYCCIRPWFICFISVLWEGSNYSFADISSSYNFM